MGPKKKKFVKSETPVPHAKQKFYFLTSRRLSPFPTCHPSTLPRVYGTMYQETLSGTERKRGGGHAPQQW